MAGVSMRRRGQARKRIRPASDPPAGRPEHARTLGSHLRAVVFVSDKFEDAVNAWIHTLIIVASFLKGDS